MGTAAVVEGEVAADPGRRVRDGVVGVQVDLFVLEGAPESFDEDVVPPAAPPVHADLDAVLEQAPGEGGAGELTALIGVEDGRRPVAGGTIGASARTSTPSLRLSHGPALYRW